MHRLLKLEIKGIGPHRLVPLLMTIAADFILGVFGIKGLITNELILFVGDLMIAPFSAWCILFVFQPVVEYESCMLFRSLPVDLKRWGMIHVMAFYAMGCILLLCNTVLMRWIVPYDLPWGWMLLRQILLSFFFDSLTFCALIFSRRVNLSIVTVMAYIFACIFLADEMPVFLNVFQSGERYPQIAGRTVASLPVAVFGGWCLLAIAQQRFERDIQSV